MWDLTTFWPRMAHPLGPPCYAERTVPEITQRVRETLEDEDSVVVLSGHSQGSTIAVAVASRLTDEELQRVKLITYGSQLRAWYSRTFPAVLGPDALGMEPLNSPWDYRASAPDAPAAKAPAEANATPGAPAEEWALRSRLWSAGKPGWINLFRRTDPIGFRVQSDLDSEEDQFVSERAPDMSLKTHSGYQFSDEYLAALDRLTRQGG